MLRKVVFFKAIALVVTVVVCTLAANGDDAVLSPGNVSVVVEPNGTKVARFAAADLTNHLSQVLGCEVPLVTDEDAESVRIFVGDSRWSRNAGIDVSNLPRDAFRVKSSGRRIYLVGRDNPKCDLETSLAKGVYPNLEHGTAFAVCEFLERYAGVRFYFPDEYGTVIPRVKSIRVPEVDGTVMPQFNVRNCYFWNNGRMPDSKDKFGEADKRALYQLRLRERCSRPPSCHGLNNFKIPHRFAATHPEYFQLRKNGTRCTELPSKKRRRAGQLCHTSPVWDVIRNDTIEKIRKGDKYVDIMPQDGMQECYCANCMARYNQTNDFALASGYCSDLVWSNTVMVANAVKAAGLKGSVTQMAYGPCRLIPDFDIPDNVAVTVAVGGPWACSRRDIFEKQVEFVKNWSGKIGRKISWAWTYPMKNYGWLQAHGVPQYAPRAYFEFHKRVAPYIDGCYIESNQQNDTLFYQYLNYYVFSKLAWNPDLDIEALLAEHHKLMFGVGAASMTRFFDRLEELWIGKVAVPSLIPETEIGPMIYPPTQLQIYRDIYSDEVMVELTGYLNAATKAVGRDSIEARRIAILRKRFITPLENNRKEFLDAVSVPAELARRKQSSAVDLLKGLSWSVDSSKGSFVDDKIRFGGENSIRLETKGDNVSVALDLSSIAGKLVPGTAYRVSCFVRGEGIMIHPNAKGRKGMRLDFAAGGMDVEYAQSPFHDLRYWCGTYDWMHQTFTLKIASGSRVAKASPKFWVRSWNVKGKFWIGGLRLEKIADVK